MSHNTDRTPTPRTERWILVMALAFVPVVAAILLPETLRIALLALSGLMFVTGFALMLRESRRSKGNESLRQLVTRPPSFENRLDA